MRILRGLLGLRKPRVRLHAASAAEVTPTQGLIQVHYDVTLAGGETAVLEVFVGDGPEPALRRPLTAGPEGSIRDWFALHGHLLPNGPASLRLRVLQGDREAAADAVTVQVSNVGDLAAWVRSRLESRGTPLIVADACDSTLYDYADASATAWFDRTPEEIEAHLAALARSGAADADEIAGLRRFAENGYVALPGAIADEHLGRLNAALDHVVENRVKGYAWGSSERIESLHESYPAIRELWTHPRILRMLELIFGAPARPCQTLSYIFGSQQEHHQDTIHLTPFPAGRMCGVWTALEDVQAGSGELMVFPKSHRLPRVYMADHGAPKVTDGDWSTFGEVIVPAWTRMIEEQGFAPTPYRAKAGDVLIWHENLMHAGAPRTDMEKSRRSIVGHYFAEGAIAYYDSSGMPGTTHQV
ncbi:phytanoyl-CoA dioxygenase family protein [Phenylobacterium sp.]|uniref:phytanoyl-CoA dioxygenase family protein n=1 Tax=Phenylobacterium sp. TaxID=1871053 RepID=UPI0025D9E166|nr:phytanoyl-CoA dioxygenase family protein [Phenylobacterium sp.]MBX3482140.1 phytanoyl-CoA dioxygenase family protein [Phenylobacterium sp.]MCW5761372.1 phytanoyl-CoA dioxygenase family protein [Phenylobacterium sp.]